MLDHRAPRRKNVHETLAGLKSAALAKLENRGYDIRGHRPKLGEYLSGGPRSQNWKTEVPLK